ncbi:MAG: inositol 2-dehydrogenase [Spirochaetaceae bacterium 4572_59]|nr:MAG: inositol 2-dehydrogenase [Spirochaetaceae bacterium 4572_59]
MKKQLVMGIIGAGRIGRVHVESICTKIPGARVKTLADPFMNEETSQWAASMGVGSTTKDYKEILSDSEIDAVLICSPTDTHAPIIREAALAGKHIFCEKPIDLDIARIKKTLEIVEKAGVKFQIGFNRRFDHNFRAIRNAVEAGKVGEPQIISVKSRDPEPPSAEYAAASGGIFVDMTIHDFDMVRYLSGSEVEEVYVQGAVLVDPAIGEAGDIDTCIISLKFASGAIGVIDNSRKAAYGYDQRAEVFGSKGSVATANDNPSTAVLSTAEGISSEKPYFFFLERYMESFTQEMREFIAAVQDDTETPLGGIDALRPVQIAMAAGESLKTGKPVKVQY